MVVEFPEIPFALLLEGHEDTTVVQSPVQVMDMSNRSTTTFWEPEGAVGTDVRADPVLVVAWVLPASP